MPARDRDERALHARIAAAERWGRSGSRDARAAATVPARAGLRAKFLREADPDGTLSEAERERGADQLMQAHMLRMSLKARTARRRSRELSAEADAADAQLAALTEVPAGGASG
jgi:hypothetical protein